MTLSDYLRLPWTVERSEFSDDGDYVVLEIRELPGFVVADRDENNLEREFWPALAAFLKSYTDAGEDVPVPEAMLPMRPQLELIPAKSAQTLRSTRFFEDSELRTKLSGHLRFTAPVAGR
jgi:hypothetical protein